MHDFDSVINKVSGQTDYMAALTKIIGNLHHCDLAIYKDRVKKIHEFESKLLEVISSFEQDRLEKTELKGSFTEFAERSASLDILNKSVIWYAKKAGKKSTKKKAPREKVADSFLPKNLVKSPWFLSVKQLERTAKKTLKSLDYDEEMNLSDNWATIETGFNTDANRRDIVTWLDYKFMNKDDLQRLVDIRQSAYGIIEQLLQPMYDYKATIVKNWHLIDNVFRANSDMAPHLVQDVLGKFTVAKYRCEIFDTTKYYMRLFNDVLNSPEVLDGNGDLDGSKFMEVIDSIDLNKFDKSANTYKFITAATPIMRKLADPNCKESMEDILKEINEAISLKPEVKPEQNTEESVNADIFG